MSDYDFIAFYWVAAILQLFMAGGIVWLARRNRPQALTLIEQFQAGGDCDQEYLEARHG